MVDSGLLKLGYEYLNIDDCWASARNTTGDNRLIADPKFFPSGMKSLADYVHSKGLKFGIYTDRGSLTCAQRPASGGFETIDAQTFADWGVDFLKEDSCYSPDVPEVAFQQYGLMRDALIKTGRPIFFSLCGWHDWYAPEGASLANSWRMAGDGYGWSQVFNAIRTSEKLYPFAKPGAWNDPDMLLGSSHQASNFMTEKQSRFQFSLWSVIAAPLLLSSNMLNMTAYDFET